MEFRKRNAKTYQHFQVAHMPTFFLNEVNQLLRFSHRKLLRIFRVSDLDFDLKFRETKQGYSVPKFRPFFTVKRILL